ncbi:MAG: hypothetical protein H6936_00910 [Burkholderiales bacterium]|nr:hypothetical protein [Burkholderiales bacterium]
MNLLNTLGLTNNDINPEEERRKLQLYINLKLASSGQPTCADQGTREFLETARDLLKSYREKNRLLADYRCPADKRIQQFLDRYLSDSGVASIPKLPGVTFVLDRHGIARELSLPMGEDEFHSEIVSSYRVKQGVLHNPASDRRTTKGSFHIAEGGLPIPGDKKAVPKKTFSIMLEHALNPPKDLLKLPFSANQATPAEMFVSLLLRPIVCPEVPGVDAEKSMEIRFFAPGNLVSNLDFVESIFGNGGNPNLAEFDAALDTAHWSGHTGCVILAPHLITLTKKELGLPYIDDANERQKREKMCWQTAGERYNDGQAFKITARDEQGVIVTILADNYYGYCKKEVKTQISYATNLYGLAEEEHAGGALAFTRRNHGEEYGIDSHTREPGYSFSKASEQYAEVMNIQPEGYAIDKNFPEVIYVPQDLRMDLSAQTITWKHDNQHQQIRLKPGKIYVQPNGYKIEMEKNPGSSYWRLIGTDPLGTFCHKPCTVSGGGKSEISKSINDAVIYGPLFVDDLQNDLRRVLEICERDYTYRFKPGFEAEDRDPARKLLSPERSLGSVIKVLTVSSSYTDEFNAWLEAIPPRIFSLLFLIKRYYRKDWGNDLCKHLSVDIVDGAPSHELKLNNRKMIASYLRIGFDREKKWRTFKVRQDFIAAEKIQMEDDISVSIVVPDHCLDECRPAQHTGLSVKLVKNCEYRLFQRPDDARIPGYDKQTEYDMAVNGNFIANYDPLKGDSLAAVVEDVMTHGSFTQPMYDLLQEAYDKGEGYVVSSAHSRLIDGKRSKNPRYLQTRPDLVNPVRKYVANMSTRMHLKLPMDVTVCHPVDAVLAGRRNNPPEPGIRPLAVYNPIHYQALPELFMDFICSLTGKSPSTTGVGSEGALTKGPFNALRPTSDLNNALVSFILTGYAGFSSSAGYVGPDMMVEHDISLLVPEIWARIKADERDPQFLIENGYLELLEDFDHEGQTVLASRLGYRITERFVHRFMGKIFDNPQAVFTEELLKPETQDMASYVDGINNIVEAQQKVAKQYIDDGSVNDACPPLYALIHIMATGEYNGKTVRDASIRELFTKDSLLSSDWYRERLEIKQQREIALWEKHVKNLQAFFLLPGHEDEVERLGISSRLDEAIAKLSYVNGKEYFDRLVGTIGADPLRPYRCMSSAQHTENKKVA